MLRSRLLTLVERNVVLRERLTSFGKGRIVTAMIKARQERGWLITFLGEGLDVAQQGVQLGTAAANVAASAGGAGLRAASAVLASSHFRYAVARSNLMEAQDAAALTPEERDALTGKK